MVRISGNENAREVKSASSSDYEKQMESLSKKIKPQAESLEDLENAKKIKKTTNCACRKKWRYYDCCQLEKRLDSNRTRH